MTANALFSAEAASTTADALFSAGAASRTAPVQSGLPVQRMALVDLLDRLLAGGVVIVGDVTISIADVDLVHVSLRALITSVSTELEGRP